MSSRSLQQAKARRTGENVPPVSGNRPITSIGSQAAFAQQMPHGMGYNMPPPPNNVRTARAQPPQQPPQAQQQMQYNVSQSQLNQSQNGLPFNKLSISDAIGLITLRLGRVEQWIMDTDHETENGSVHKSSDSSSVPDGYKIIENSILTTIINRLDSLEKNGGQSEDLTNTIKSLTEQFKRMSDDVSKHTIEIAKNTEQVFRFNRELTETKDILKSFMVKYDMFTQEISQNFSDYEFALSELEKKILVEDVVPESEAIQEPSKEENETNGENIILSTELKNNLKEELLNIK